MMTKTNTLTTKKVNMKEIVDNITCKLLAETMMANGIKVQVQEDK